MESLTIKSALTLAVAASLVACGGGTGSSTPSDTANTDTPTAPRPPETQPTQTPVDYSQLSDPALNACVAATGIEYREQLQTLECNHKQIRSVDGLNQFSQLRVLSLQNNQISFENDL